MSISAIYLDKETFEAMGVGLSELPLDKPIEMRGLGTTVVLAGPNGAGKSRLLRLLPKLFQKNLFQASRVSTRSSLRLRIGDLDKKFISEARRLPDLQTLKSKWTSDGRINYSDELEIDRLYWSIRCGEVMDVDSDPVSGPISFVPKSPHIESNGGLSQAEVASRASNHPNSPEDAHRNTSSYATSVIKQAEKAELLRLRDNGRTLTLEELSLNELRATTQRLLGESFPLELDPKDESLLIGSADSFVGRLSPGQQILFQFACLLHAKKANLKNCIVLMDEPENHLHPAVLVQVIEALQAHLTGGQLWIATHSVPLIANLVAKDSNCLRYVDNGQVKRAGRSPEKVLESLMGGPEGTKYLHDLTMLPTQYAAIQFLTECLDPPGVVGADIKDPQTNDIAFILREISAAKKERGGKVRILDFGAGKGRLLATLREGSPTLDWVDYFAYDIGTENQIDCEREIAAAYPDDGQPRWFDNLHLLEAKLGVEAFDVVVMCNVLHEVDPDEWSSLFKPSGKLSNLMHKDGRLLIVEDYGIPVGERAHDCGFLLLDEPEIRRLFDILPADRDANHYETYASAQPRYVGRLKAHLVSKTCLTRITSASQFSAIQMLHDRMLDEVKNALKQKDGRSGDSGRTYARSAQLVANARIWLDAHGLHGSSNALGKSDACLVAKSS
jgi:energy-coupling factor transporter ATP-binding protein EcfA2